ncbi:bifunctional hydroxymethylpyrimidine kinase/phosphomethylpyrimidine kinase [Weissella viridescens]|uniref:pyridoxal kinase n=1 Tax=Weissella viridescens TaxID=1629 RepID=A0A3P2RJA7_WEIVI|nr:bifunctional hydroxymethylpyrimidine kinase/phosphomethylpyrimidine kinase [Weissella viridescens]RRG17792.1 bifunctional hydroxymethylpyrimidine kinase/phosphomethylpyrimidine kinase [Weissella viridescens]
MVRKIVTIAGSDSLAGGGIQADLATFDEYYFQGLSVITSIVTVIDDDFTIHPVAPKLVLEQMQSIFALEDIAAVKIGLLPSQAHIELVANFLREHVQDTPTIVDPVMVFKETDDADTTKMVQAMRTNLLPIATVVTPNLPEAELLSGQPIHSSADLTNAAKQILQLGSQAVYAKGGTRLAGNQVSDVLVTQTGFEAIYTQPKLTAKTNNGAGCTLSAAIASNLGQAQPLADAVQKAQAFVHAGIAHGVPLNQSFDIGNVWQGAQRAIREGKIDEN